jgi:hypothetical protein
VLKGPAWPHKESRRAYEVLANVAAASGCMDVDEASSMLASVQLPVSHSPLVVSELRKRSGAGRTRTSDRRIMSPLL